MSERRRIAVVVERFLLLVGSPLLFLLLAELVIGVSGIETEAARNKNAKIAVPVWLLADENWVRDRQTKLRRSGGEPIAAEEVEWLYHFEEARHIQYKLKPLVDVQAVNPFNEIEVEKNITFRLTSNRDGFRERPFVPKQAGVVRIVTLGDSSTFGWGVDAEHTYQRQLEERLNARYLDRRFEVLNLGIPGYNSRHGVGVLRHYAEQMEPDVMIFGFGANDPRLVPAPTSTLLDRDTNVMSGIRFGLLKLRTYSLLRRLVFTLRDPIATGRQEELVEAVSLPQFRDNLRTFVSTASAIGGRSVFVSVCTGIQSYAEAMREIASEQNVPMLDVRQLFTDNIEALKAGPLYPDLVAAYRQRYGRRAMDHRQSLYVTSDGCHPHRVGHSLIADRLADIVDRELRQR